MESFLIAVNAVVPFLVYMGAGYAVRMVHLADEDLLYRLNQLVFSTFLPLLLFYNIYSIENVSAVNIALPVTGITVVLCVVAVLCVAVPRLVKENAKRGVYIQAIYRSNYILFAMPLVESVFGSQSNGLTALMAAIAVPTFNVLAVVVLEYFRGGTVSKLELVKKVLSNPLIIGAFFGVTFLLLGIHLPDYIDSPVSRLSDMATPLALFVLGGTLRFASLRRDFLPLLAASAVKLVFIPSLVLILCFVLGFNPLERFILFALFATPTAVASFPMAQSMGGDGRLAGELVFATTVFSVFTLFVWIYCLSYFGGL